MNNKKEELLITALGNMLKAKSFLQMCLMLEQDQITQEEYEKELKDNREFYVIDIKNTDNRKDIEIIAEIVKELGPIAKGLSVSDVSETFSLDGKQVVEFYQFGKEPGS